MNSFYTSATGRVSRQQWWLRYALPYFGIALIIGALSEALASSAEIAVSMLELVFNVAGTYVSVCVNSKRFHDRNMSGWWALWFMLLIFVPAFIGGFSLGMSGELEVISMLFFAITGVVVITQFVILGLLPGKKGPNEYGADPLDPNGVESVEDVFS